MPAYGSPQFMALDKAEQELREAFGGRKANRKQAWMALHVVRIHRAANRIANRKG